MDTYITPGVYVEEISIFPPSVTAVATAVPAFIGYTAKAFGENGEDLTNIPTRVTSLLEFETFFGKANIHVFSVDVIQKFVAGTSQLTATKVAFNGTPPAQPSHFFYYAMQMYFSNGGGPAILFR